MQTQTARRTDELRPFVRLYRTARKMGLSGPKALALVVDGYSLTPAQAAALAAEVRGTPSAPRGHQ